MRRFLLLAAAATGARAQLTEFSSHIVLDGFDVERFNRPDRLAHINLFGVLMRVFFDEPDSTYVRYFDRDASRYAEAYEHDGSAGGKIPYMVTSPESYEVLKERMRVALESGELQRIIDTHSESSIISNAPVNVKASLHFLGHSHHETEPAPGPAPAPRPRGKDDDDDDGLSGLDIFLIVFFVILFAVFNVMAFLVYQKRKREREEDGIALVPAPTYLHPSLHHKTFPGAGPAASYRGRSGAFSDELQPTESFRNVSDPQYEFGTLGGDDMGKAFA